MGFQERLKRVVTLVSDYGPGIDVEKAFTETFTKAGGQVENLRVPLANPDFSPFLQKVADSKPDALLAFVPSGAGAQFMKQFVERGLDKSGIRLPGGGQRHGRRPAQHHRGCGSRGDHLAPLFGGP